MRCLFGEAEPVERPGTKGAICIYVDGKPQFMDELELLDNDAQDRVLEVYTSLGLNQICIGPAYALIYDHHNDPPIDWATYDPLPLLRKFKELGLHTTLAWMPDCPPYYTNGGWDFGLYLDRYGKVFEAINAERLVNSIRLEWETLATNDDFCIATQLASAYFPGVPIFYHNPVGHLSPGLSSEDERVCWELFLKAGGTGIDLQCGTPYSREDALAAMKYDLWDMRRRALGSSGSPWGGPMLTQAGVPFTVRNAEYSAYDIFHNNLPWNKAQFYGQTGMGVVGPGDDTALDGI